MSRVTLWSCVLVLVAFAAPVSADTPEVIQACYRNTGGRLRIVTDTAECRSTETAISWRAQPANPPTFQLVGFTTATFLGDAGQFA